MASRRGFSEQGFKNMVFEEQFCLYLPPGASAEVVDRLNKSTERAMKLPEMAMGLGTFAIVPTTSTPAALAALQKSGHDKWGAVVRSIGFTAET